MERIEEDKGRTTLYHSDPDQRFRRGMPINACVARRFRRNIYGMKYWKVSLLREGRCARQWHVRAEILTVGSHGSNKVRLPPPVEAFALQISELSAARTCEVGPFTLVVEDETHERSELWTEARLRVNDAVSAASAAPREAPVPIRAAIAVFTLLGLTNLAGSLVVDRQPHVLRAYERNRAALVAGAPSDPSAPRYEASTATATPMLRTRDADRVPVALASRSGAARLVVLLGDPSPAGSPAGSSWDGGLISHGNGLPDPSANPSAWLASTPERYRAPWPDAPVPPH
jgi:hypothetical protein